MKVLVVLGVVAALGLLYGVERIIRWRRRLRQRRQMAYRLATAAARGVAAERTRKAAAVASAELTSVIPGINSPRPTFGSLSDQARTPGSRAQ